MKRFVDIRAAAISGVRFAWWDTVTDRFESHSGTWAWDTWDDFFEDYKSGELDRYYVLCPAWVFEPAMEDADDMP